MREIKIGDKEVLITSSAYTILYYQERFGRNLLQDLNEIENVFKQLSLKSEEDKESNMIEYISLILPIALRVAFAMAQEATEETLIFEKWSKQFAGLFDNMQWISETYKEAMCPFRSQR